MSDVVLTKNADKLLKAIYKNYLQKSKQDLPQNKCRFIGYADDIQKTICPELSLDKIEVACHELCEYNFLSFRVYDNICSNIQLTSDGISYMENKIPNLIDKVIDTATKFIP